MTKDSPLSLIFPNIFMERFEKEKVILMSLNQKYGSGM